MLLVDDTLSAIVQTLLPGHGRWPSATDLGLADSLAEAGSKDQGLADALDSIGRRLPATFASAGVEERVSRLRAIETILPVPFGLLVERAYGIYYMHPRVTHLLETRVGYPDRPPQPQGHFLEPFNNVALAITGSREPFYRKTAKNDRSSGSNSLSGAD